MVYPYFNMNNYMPNYLPYNTGGIVGNVVLPIISKMLSDKNNLQVAQTTSQTQPTSYARLFPVSQIEQKVEPQLTQDDLTLTETELDINTPTGVEPSLKTPTVGSVLPQSITPLKDVVSPATSYIFPTLTNNKVTSGFGNRKAPLPGASTYHQGIDIAGKIGDPLRAVVAGTILEVGKNNLIGNYLKMLGDTGETFTYGHAKSFGAKKGQKVKAGDLLGLLGNTGNSTGPHVHFMASRDNKYFNPMNLYGANYDK